MLRSVGSFTFQAAWRRRDIGRTLTLSVAHGNIPGFRSRVTRMKEALPLFGNPFCIQEPPMWCPVTVLANWMHHNDCVTLSLSNISTLAAA